MANFSPGNYVLFVAERGILARFFPYNTSYSRVTSVFLPPTNGVLLSANAERDAVLSVPILRCCRFLGLTAGVAICIGTRIASSTPIAKTDQPSFDAEQHIGLVPGDSSFLVAEGNTKRLSAALQAMWFGGWFRFTDGSEGPILKPICCAGKTFFFRGTIETNIRIGGVLRGAGIGYEMSDAGYLDERAPQGGMITRFVKIDPENGPFVRLRGAAFTLEGIEFYGRRLLVGDARAATGPKTKTLIEVEGRTSPVCTGYHQLRNIALNEAECGIRAMAGYYRDGQFVPSEDHADQTSVDRLHCSALDCVYRSENHQAVFWNFRNIIVNDFGYGTETIVFDIHRGGNLNAENIQMNYSRITLLRVNECPAPNANRINIHNIEWDHSATTGDNFLTLFKYIGPAEADASSRRWSVRMSGHMNNPHLPYDRDRLIVIPVGAKNFPKDDLLFDIHNLPNKGFSTVSIPWMKPN